MPTLKELCVETSRQLNDQRTGIEFTRWTRDMLIGYASDAFIQVSLYRPDAFTKPEQVALVPGVRQQLPPGVISIASVLDNNDRDNPLAVMRDDLGLVRAFNKKPCSYDLDAKGNVVYRLTAYSYDPRLPGYFFVSPPVPTGMNPPPVIGISGVIDPPTLTKADWLNPLPISTNKYYNAFIAWMLSRAFEIDTESENSFRNMQFQRAEFYKMMGVKYQMESKFNSAWYLGQRGYESNVRGTE